jgi:hypothetical protein
MALAVPLSTLNDALARLFADRGAAMTWTAVISEEYGMDYNVRCGAPVLSMDDGSVDTVRLSFRIIEGSWQGGTVWNAKQKAFQTIVEELSGHDVVFSVALKQMADPDVAADAVSVEHLYLDLTSIGAIDTTLHEVDPGDPHLKVMFTAFVKALQEAPQVNKGSLFIMTTKTQQKPPSSDSSSALRPRKMTYGLCAGSQRTNPELLALMMRGDADLPTQATARIQNGPWVSDAGKAALVLSGRCVLEALVAPALTKLMATKVGDANQIDTSTTFADATDASPARLSVSRTVRFNADDHTLFYTRASKTTEIGASVNAGAVVIDEKTTFTVEAYGTLGRYAKSQPIFLQVTLAPTLVGKELSLKKTSRDMTRIGDVETSNSGALGVIGLIGDMLGTMPKSVVLDPKALIANLGSVAFPLSDVTLPGTQGFDVAGVRGVSDAFVIALQCQPAALSPPQRPDPISQAS